MKKQTEIVMGDIEKRIERLEKSSKRWRAVAIIALALSIFTLFQTALLNAVGLRSAVKFDHLQVRSLDIINGSGTTVGMVFATSDGAMLSLSSLKPNEYHVSLSADQRGANVQVISQAAPRQFGELKIMDHKPYLQMFEEQSAGTPAKNFYQAPIYMNDGSIGQREIQR